MIGQEDGIGNHLDEKHGNFQQEIRNERRKSADLEADADQCSIQKNLRDNIDRDDAGDKRLCAVTEQPCDAECMVLSYL